ncbi:MAG TPA: FAD-dependent oxidoreductase [Candidatus Nanoarchaeia archaeon]|nr:FAD-dependent oxidoreductase [Candidatus Nanoarchaeia archaeon]
MKEYDVIIIGAGIAGSGLAYNLNKECPEKKVLIIDAKEPGSNASYGYRNIMESLQKEYNFPYEHMYKGMKIGIEDKIFFTLNRKFYFINYKKICNKLLRESKAEFKKGFAKEFNSKILKTDKECYKFKYLVDCSGSSFFIKKKLRHKLPFRYWMAKTRVLKNELKDKDYYYYQFHDSGYFEDIYPLKNKTLQGDWQYTEKRDLNLLKPIENQLYKKLISKPKIIKEYIVGNPCTPVLPLVYKNIAFLGDSFGNPVTSSACGIKPILDTSKILSKAIKKNNLKLYEKEWKKRYLEIYIRYLVPKYYTYHKLKYFQKFKKPTSWFKLIEQFEKYPELFETMFDGEKQFKLPKETKKIFHKSSKIFQGAYYIYLKYKYYKMSKFYRIN